MLPATTIEMRDLRLVRAIVEAGGLTRAARELALSQSAVSHQLKTLEERLGVGLFERVGRGVRATDAARRIVDLSRQVLELTARTERELRGTPRQRTLRLASQCDTAYAWLPAVVGELTVKHPDVALHVASVAGDPLVALTEGALDLALLVDPASGRGIASMALFEDELVAVLAPDHRLAKRRWVDGDELAGETLILQDVPRRVRERVRRHLFPNGGTFRRSMRIPWTEAVIELVRAGHGISIVPSWSVLGATARREIVGVRLTRRGLRRRWTAVWRRGSDVSDAIAALCDLIQSRCAPPRGRPT